MKDQLDQSYTFSKLTLITMKPFFFFHIVHGVNKFLHNHYVIINLSARDEATWVLTNKLREGLLDFIDYNFSHHFVNGITQPYRLEMHQKEG